LVHTNVNYEQVTDESGTYIIEPVSGEEYYSEDPNIMWIQETVEVEQESYDNLPNMVRIICYCDLISIVAKFGWLPVQYRYVVCSLKSVRSTGTDGSVKKIYFS
jgi:hypothetical protein